jgi:hypothetical protein
MPANYGDPIHGEVISADASGAGVAFTLYPAGSSTARVLTANEFVVVTDIVFVSTAGGVYDLIFGPTVAAGKHIAKGNADALGGLAHHFETPRSGEKGLVPRLIAAAGQVDCTISGFITQV